MTSEHTYFGMVSQLGPSRRQKLMRQRWLMAGAVVAVTATLAAIGQWTDRERAAEREQAAVSVAAASF